MIITRNLINRDIEFTYNYSNYHYSFLCNEINRVKRALLYFGAQKGDTVAVAHLTIDPYHIAIIFAAAELGLKLLVIDMPATRESLPYCKLSLFGPADFTFIGNDDMSMYKNRPRPFNEMIGAYSRFVISRSDLPSDDSPVNVPWEVNEDDPLLITSSSGTTNWSKQVILTHKEVYAYAKRHVDLWNFKKEDRIAHSKNLHHGASLMISFLPGLMTCDHNLSANIADYREYFEFNIEKYENMIKFINSEGFNRIMIPNPAILDAFFEVVDRTIGRFDKTLLITVYTFTLCDKLVELCKKYNVEFVISYGSIAAHLFTLGHIHITKDTTLENAGSIGKVVDDFYKIKSIKGKSITVEHSLLNCDYTLDDNLEIREDGSIVLLGRVVDENASWRAKVKEIADIDFAVVQNDPNVYLALFEKTDADFSSLGFKDIRLLDKELFDVESKLNYDALRGHFIYYNE